MAEEKPTVAAAPADAATGAPPKEEGAEGAEGEAGEPKKKEHVVSIVLSYMNDEHEKAAIEVVAEPSPDERRRPRSPDPDPRSSSWPHPFLSPTAPQHHRLTRVTTTPRRTPQ